MGLQLKKEWRVGRKVPINVYEGERPICQCHTPVDAERIVEAINYRKGANMDSDLFAFHKLNPKGQAKAIDIADAFGDLLETLKDLCPEPTREFSITKTKLEEACFFAKKSMATQPENQVTE